MTGPSNQMLQLINQIIQQKGINSARLAAELGMERKVVKRLLRGEIELTVNQLFALTECLDLQESDLAQMGLALNLPESGSGSATVNDEDKRSNEHSWQPDPNGNATMQLVRMGFELGTTIFLLLDSSQLTLSGIPSATLDHFKPKLPIRLDPEFHHYNEPRFRKGGLELKLSFDQVYDCFLPWSAFEQVTFYVDEEPESESESSEEGKPEESTGAPFLRLVT